jgi:hypothetical protein
MEREILGKRCWMRDEFTAIARDRTVAIGDNKTDAQDG